MNSISCQFISPGGLNIHIQYEPAVPPWIMDEKCDQIAYVNVASSSDRHRQYCHDAFELKKSPFS